MRKSLLFLLIVSFLTCFVPCLGARNLITHRPFDWERLEREIADGGYELWYPKQMQHLIPATQAIIDEIYDVYSQEVFTKIETLTVISDSIVVDTLTGNTVNATYDSAFVSPWYDKKRVILVYPGLQDFTQQKLIGGLMPPGVLGFNELRGWRVAVPFPGSYVLYKNVMYHELAHAWMFQYVREAAQAKKVKIRANYFPLWFIEGFAELLNRRFNQDYNQDYLSILRDDFMRMQICGLTHPVPEVARINGMDVYSFGHSFMEWVVDGYGIEKVIEILAKSVCYAKFGETWQEVFGKEFSEMSEEWHQWLQRKYFKAVYADELVPTLEKVKNAPISLGYSTYDQGKMAYFARDAKWNIQVLVKDLENNQIWRIHHMFKNMSLWYRLNNPPVIQGNLVALVVNKEGQDELHIYQLRKKKVKRIKLLREKEIVSISNPSFNENGTKIVFEGIALNGLSDIYIWDMELNKTERCQGFLEISYQRAI